MPKLAFILVWWQSECIDRTRAPSDTLLDKQDELKGSVMDVLKCACGQYQELAACALWPTYMACSSMLYQQETTF